MDQLGFKYSFRLITKLPQYFFDSAIYKVGDKKKKILFLTQNEDIDKLNILQFINCFSTIFFDEKAPEHYIRSLHNESLKYERANKSQSELSFIVKEGEKKEDVLNPGKENLMILNRSDCEINLNINGLKIHSKGKNHKLNSTMSQLRKHPENLRRKEEMIKKAAKITKYSACRQAKVE